MYWGMKPEIAGAVKRVPAGRILRPDRGGDGEERTAAGSQSGREARIMKNQAYRMTMLFDFYGDMLTEKQKQIFDLYHNEDLSLAEIAEITGITRQGVRDSVVRSEAALRTMEEKTGLIARFRETEERRAEIHRLVDEFAKSPDFHHITNVSADRIRKIWFLSRSAEETEE